MNKNNELGEFVTNSWYKINIIIINLFILIIIQTQF